MTTASNGTRVNGTDHPLRLTKVDDVWQLKPEQPAPAPAARPVEKVPPRRDALWRRTARKSWTVASHERTREAGRLVARHSLYVGGGCRIVSRRVWDARTSARYQRMMRSAEAAGRQEEAADWEEREHRFRNERHKRRMELLRAPQEIARGAATAAGTSAVGLLVLGGVMAVATGQVSDVLVPLNVAIETIRWVVVVATVVWGPLMVAIPLFGLLALWDLGRRNRAAPQWALPEGEKSGRAVVPDESAILNALRHLGIGPLNTAFKEGWLPRWESGTCRFGKGYHAQLQLPMGVTVEMINDKKDVLAHNLLRLAIEVWPTQPRDNPGTLDLWVADQGSLTAPVPPWPLLTEGTTDYFKGVPAGISQRGETITAKLMAKNYMVGGIMGTGKSSLVIELLLGAMLDPLVEIDVYCMAFNVDYDAMRPRLRTLVKGDEDEQVEAALEALRKLRDEVTLRGKLLESLGGKEMLLTREIAEKDPRMRPRVVVFDECHELFMHKKHKAEAEELAIKVMKKARKLGITLIWATVSPVKDSIPRDVTRNTSHGVAFAVGDHVANDGLLGTGKHSAGITATTLNPAEDIGTALTVGFTKNQFELIRSYWVRKDAEVDQITPVVKRALALREGVEAAPAPEEAEEPDHLADISTVLGAEERVRTHEVLHLLEERNPAVYRKWTFADLKGVLEPVGAAPYKSDGVMVVSRERVREALAERDREAADDDSELREAAEDGGSSP